MKQLTSKLLEVLNTHNLQTQLSFSWVTALCAKGTVMLIAISCCWSTYFRRENNKPVRISIVSSGIYCVQLYELSYDSKLIRLLDSSGKVANIIMSNV